MGLGAVAHLTSTGTEEAALSLYHRGSGSPIGPKRSACGLIPGTAQLAGQRVAPHSTGDDSPGRGGATERQRQSEQKNTGNKNKMNKAMRE